MDDSVNICLRRRAVCGASLSIFLLPSCKGGPRQVSLDISLFNYLDRPIYDVSMSGTHFMAAPAHGFYGANSVMLMQIVTLGAQTVTWKLGGPEGMPRNGETAKARNQPSLNEVPKGVKWLGLHIYPDETVEIKLSHGADEDLQTDRGLKIIAARERENES